MGFDFSEGLETTDVSPPGGGVGGFTAYTNTLVVDSNLGDSIGTDGIFDTLENAVDNLVTGIESLPIIATDLATIRIAGVETNFPSTNNIPGNVVLEGVSKSSKLKDGTITFDGAAGTYIKIKNLRLENVVFKLTGGGFPVIENCDAVGCTFELDVTNGLGPYGNLYWKNNNLDNCDINIISTSTWVSLFLSDCSFIEGSLITTSSNSSIFVQQSYLLQTCLFNSGGTIQLQSCEADGVYAMSPFGKAISFVNTGLNNIKAGTKVAFTFTAAAYTVAANRVTATAHGIPKNFTGSRLFIGGTPPTGDLVAGYISADITHQSAWSGNIITVASHEFTTGDIVHFLPQSGSINTGWSSSNYEYYEFYVEVLTGSTITLHRDVGLSTPLPKGTAVGLIFKLERLDSFYLKVVDVDNVEFYSDPDLQTIVPVSGNSNTFSTTTRAYNDVQIKNCEVDIDNKDVSKLDIRGGYVNNLDLTTGYSNVVVHENVLPDRYPGTNPTVDGLLGAATIGMYGVDVGPWSKNQIKAESKIRIVIPHLDSVTQFPFLKKEISTWGSSIYEGHYRLEIAYLSLTPIDRTDFVFLVGTALYNTIGTEITTSVGANGTVNVYENAIGDLEIQNLTGATVYLTLTRLRGLPQ